MLNHVKLPITHTPQYDGHTCGLCAASSIYRFYGMDPDDYQLRAYLGVDNILPYNFPARERIEAWLGGTEAAGVGTMPMDMLAVLYWDGFDTQTVVRSTPRTLERLHDHLTNGDPALALMYGCCHWVVVTGMDDEGVWIADSILRDLPGRRKQIYRLPYADFTRFQHGMILVSRGDEADERLIRDITYLDFAREYARGVAWAAAMVGKRIPGWMKFDRFLPRPRE